MTLCRSRFLLLVLLLAQLGLTGCGSIMGSAGAEPMEHDPGERSLGARMDDETIETRAMVNIDASDEALKASHINVISYNGVYGFFNSCGSLFLIEAEAQQHGCRQDLGYGVGNIFSGYIGSRTTGRLVKSKTGFVKAGRGQKS